jgi:XTP/dITP diphosphohydrolase
VRVLFASSNPHKLDELRAIFDGTDIELVGLDTVANVPAEPIEDGDTFEANARIKARYYAKELDEACLAEDSGLEVDALDGAPGVYSARYANVDGTRDERDAANNEKLLRELTGVPDDKRSARFVCAMCLARPDGSIVTEHRGTYEGRIAHAPAGENGFGYDPLLYLPDAGCSSAELSPAKKNARSHRGTAARALLADLTAKSGP